jgi:hypothetical protein
MKKLCFYLKFRERVRVKTATITDIIKTPQDIHKIPTILPIGVRGT